MELQEGKQDTAEGTRNLLSLPDSVLIMIFQEIRHRGNSFLVSKKVKEICEVAPGQTIFIKQREIKATLNMLQQSKRRYSTIVLDGIDCTVGAFGLICRIMRLIGDDAKDLIVQDCQMTCLEFSVLVSLTPNIVKLVVDRSFEKFEPCLRQFPTLNLHKLKELKLTDETMLCQGKLDIFLQLPKDILKTLLIYGDCDDIIEQLILSQGNIKEFKFFIPGSQSTRDLPLALNYLTLKGLKADDIDWELVPNILRHQPQLKELNFIGLCTPEVVGEISRISFLESLSLNTREVSGPVMERLGKLKLKRLRITCGRVNSKEQFHVISQFANTKLEKLSLDMNDITEEDVIRLGRSNPNLKSLYLSGNLDVNGLPLVLKHFPLLQYMQCSCKVLNEMQAINFEEIIGDGMTGNISLEAFNDCTRLEQVTGPGMRIFTRMFPNLRSLNFGLDRVDDDCIEALLKNLRFLKRLYVLGKFKADTKKIFDLVNSHGLNLQSIWLNGLEITPESVVEFESDRLKIIEDALPMFHLGDEDEQICCNRSTAYELGEFLPHAS